MPRSTLKACFLAIVCLIALGCSSYQNIEYTQRKVETSRELAQKRLGWMHESTSSTYSFSYAENKKTIIVAPAWVESYSCQGIIENSAVLSFVPYNPLYELIELPQGAIEFALLPLTLFFNKCTGKYEGKLDHNNPWLRNIKPVLLKLCPIANDSSTIIGTRSMDKSTLEVQTSPADPWTEKKMLPAEVKLVSVTPAEGNSRKVTVIDASQNEKNEIIITFSVGGKSSQFIVDCKFNVEVEIDGETFQIPLSNKFDNIWKQF